ncbi:polysaccharide deacetylase family protein [Paenibacillus sp. GSMTC-2017]|uniref:polysaccharide deacetylase family protein n=1 Tax=Paenibacillus sp. GSMTC-2017 TaxID=2794350 RepID=UPI0018D6AA50|nr:polysaccharide deacetylase family protein [Paenibacillus sp. GSMTC-2017]MBH5317733.1 polysaccharide deacetylase family protein [Paenibacillus sp. GSMTC-2017]
MNLATALGYKEEDRLLIVNADDFGLNYSVNAAAKQLLKEEAISSATLMMPCAWARDGALWSAENPQYDVGIHFTFTSEWGPYSWGPVTSSADVSTLITEEGYFYKDSLGFEQHATSEHVTIELINQLEKALKLGMTPTHADNHMGSLYGLRTGKHFMVEVLDVCASYGLPFRLPRYLTMENGQIAPPEMKEQAAAIAALADSKGVVIIDYLVGLPFQLQEEETYDSFKTNMIELLSNLKPGVTELIIHPSLLTEELKSFHLEPEKRNMEYNIFRDPEIIQTLQGAGIKLIRWSELQKLQKERNHKSI